MAKMIYYGDNLFFLGEMIRVLKDGLELEVDSSYFSEKVTEDLTFIDRTLEKIYSALSDSPLLVDRPEHLKNLMRAERQFADLLDQILQEQFGLTEELRPLFPRLSEAAEDHRRNIKNIQSILSHADAGESGDMISPAEYEFLLMNREEEK